VKCKEVCAFGLLKVKRVGLKEASDTWQNDLTFSFGYCRIIAIGIEIAYGINHCRLFSAVSFFLGELLFHYKKKNTKSLFALDIIHRSNYAIVFYFLLKSQILKRPFR